MIKAGGEMEMLCPKCGDKLSSDEYCNNCNIKVEVYKKILNTSKFLYNQGLELAQIRDLTNALKVLNQSIKFDKNNIDARNLLGLVYFEIGETVQAIKHWSISKNIKPTDNIASEYLDIIQKNQSNLNQLNTAIKKYNQSLNYIHQKSEDLAIIQLRKVISINPRFIKAYCLLALCYIKLEQKSKAVKYLQKVLNIDNNNYVAKKYLDLIDRETIEQNLDDKIEQSETGKYNPIITTSSLQQLIFIFVGLILGLAVSLFLIIPSKIKSKNNEIEKLSNELEIIEEQLNEQANLYNTELNKNKELTNKYNEIEQEYNYYYDIVNELEDVIKAINYYEDGDLANATDQLILVNKSVLEETEFYNWFSEFNDSVALDNYNLGMNYYWRYSKTYYLKAIEQFDKCLKLKDYEDALYFRGISYFNIGEYSKAAEDFNDLIQKHPDSRRIESAKWYINQISLYLN